MPRLALANMAAFLALVAGLPAAPARAEAPDGAAVAACVEAAIAAQSPVADCVGAAHAPCLSIPAEAPAAATLCFNEMRDGWGALIAARLEALEAGDPEIAAIAGIEVKYDLLTNLLQCDRMNEMVLLRAEPSEMTALQDARCKATATGLAHVKLLLQSRDLP